MFSVLSPSVNKLIATTLLASGLVLSGPLQASSDQKALNIEFTLPEIASGQYQRPYVAVWVENEKGKAVKTLAVWHEDKKWLKDLRRWWRKSGRYQKEDLDGISGATRAPGTFTLNWDGTDMSGQAVKPGKYTLRLEAAREHGSRTQLKQGFILPDGQQTYRIKAGKELGPVVVQQY